MEKLKKGMTYQNLSPNLVKYECDTCKDEEWIYTVGSNVAKPCKCKEVKLYKRIIETSGITEAFLNRNFDNYKVTNKITENMKSKALDYVNTFELIKETKNNSLALLGQVGSGKSHISIAIANELMSKNIGVRYMQYREDITRIKQAAGDEQNYNREINKFKNATVLLIDDLYKSATFKNNMGQEYLNDADKRAMFEIINYRYFKGLPIIISSEFGLMKLIALDEGIGTRILEMCKNYIIEISGKENNYRVHGN